MRKITSIKQEEIKEKWYLVDATDHRIGTLATKVAELLQGKQDPMYRKNLVPQTKVVVVNASKMSFTTKRGLTKFYKNYSGFPDGLKFTSLEDMYKKDPRKPIEIAVKGMLPKTKRGELMFENLRVFPGSTHKHEAQQPETVDIKKIKL